ncbi:MAG: hypothetical protein K5663_08370 [Clostridiales bacterium]|nr:hypothetical protein [Clostridiales bacterium]
MKKVHVSTIPGLKSKINLIAIFTLACLTLQAVSTVLSGITVFKAIVYLVSAGVNVLLIYNLYAVLMRERTFEALDALSKTLKVVFICACVLLGIMGLLVLLCIIILLIVGAQAGEMWLCTVLMVIPTAQMFIRVKYYKHTSKVAKKLENDEYDGSETPETWAIICAASYIVYLFVMLILTFATPAVIEVDQTNNLQRRMAQLADTITKRNNNILVSILTHVTSVLQCASCFGVSLLLRIVRLNMPVARK